ncbi:MAG TPA: dihydrodipicolinate reductase C-terminal domain-containing protein [Candidatus Saccharimonadales bacterium]|nr:dihydrodipicolinate reductase C-terminal domain-containing protein [Candidatus Saccharimonadales bacterium]
MRALILGRGNMGRGIRDAITARGDEVVAMLGRPTRDEARPDPSTLGQVDVAFEFSHAATVLDNVRYALATGCRAIVLGTTGWTDDRAAVGRLVSSAGATLVDAPSYSIGVVLFGELAETAARLFGRFDTYDPYVLEWHRRAKPDRPSGTAAMLADRILPHLPTKSRARLAEGSTAPEPDTLEIVSLRAGASPGMHVVGFDAPGESIELRITARDRSAYLAGALLASEWLLHSGAQRPVGLYPFDSVVRTILSEPTTPADALSQGSPTSNPTAQNGAHAVTEESDVLAR